MSRVTVIGGGLAGCEAAFQLARHGIGVDLFEMRPTRNTEAHQSDRLAEIATQLLGLVTSALEILYLMKRCRHKAIATPSATLFLTSIQSGNGSRKSARWYLKW